MKFNSSTEALEWYARHRLGSSGQRTEHDRHHGTFDGAQVAAADIEKMLERFPVAHQKALITMAITGRVATLKVYPHFELFLDHVARTFKRALTEAGYLKRPPIGASLQAAA
jgi:hypothetical protein